MPAYVYVCICLIYHITIANVYAARISTCIYTTHNTLTYICVIIIYLRHILYGAHSAARARWRGAYSYIGVWRGGVPYRIYLLRHACACTHLPPARARRSACCRRILTNARVWRWRQQRAKQQRRRWRRAGIGGSATTIVARRGVALSAATARGITLNIVKHIGM